MQQQGGAMGMMFPIVLFVLIFYFLIFRPQKKKQQQHDKMISSIGRGDTVVTAGGFFGKVSDILEDSYIIELADGVKVRILKTSISVKREGSDPGAVPKSDHSDRPDRPRRKKRRRPLVEGDAATPSEAQGDVNEADDVSSETAASSEGVTEAENEALLQLDNATGEATEEATEKANTENEN